MYTRTYFTEDEKTKIPENYDGNAFRSEISAAVTEENRQEYKEDGIDEAEYESASKSIRFPSLFEKLPLKKLLGFFRIQQKDECESDGAFGFGIEEILICALALYMFFSKDGDKECAIMLAILLFIR